MKVTSPYLRRTTTSLMVSPVSSYLHPPSRRASLSGTDNEGRLKNPLHRYGHCKAHCICHTVHCVVLMVAVMVVVKVPITKSIRDDTNVCTFLTCRNQMGMIALSTQMLRILPCIETLACPLTAIVAQCNVTRG
jgi:hypothetical protein